MNTYRVDECKMIRLNMKVNLKVKLRKVIESAGNLSSVKILF